MEVALKMGNGQPGFWGKTTPAQQVHGTAGAKPRLALRLRRESYLLHDSHRARMSNQRKKKVQEFYKVRPELGSTFILLQRLLNYSTVPTLPCLRFPSFSSS